MRYEFIHDSIAKQVFYKAGAEAQTRRKVEKYIREHYEAFEERGAELTEDDIDYIHPYLGVVNISPEEAQFVKEGEARLKNKRLRRRALAIGTIAVLFAAFIISLFFLGRARSAEQAAQASFEEATRQQGIAQAKSDSLEIREEALQLALDRVELANDTAEMRRIEAELSQVRAIREALRADRARRQAERRSLEAQSLAMAVKARTIEDDQPIIALKLAQVAYGKIPKAPLPTVSQTLGNLFYEQFSEGDEPGAPLFEAMMPYDREQYSQEKAEGRMRFEPQWSPDGQYYLLPQDGGRVGLYRMDGKLVVQLQHASATYLAYGLENVGTSRSGIPQRRPKEEMRTGPPPVDAAAWSPDSRRFATGDQAGNIYVWDLTGSQVMRTELPDWVSQLQFSPDGRYLYAWSENFGVSYGGPLIFHEPSSPALWICDLASRLPARETAIVDAGLQPLIFSSDGQSFLLPSGQYELTGQQKWSFGAGNRSLQYAADNNTVVTANNTQLSVWSLDRQQQLFTKGSEDRAVRQVALSERGNRIVVLFEDRSIDMYSSKGAVTGQLAANQYFRIAVSPDGRYVVTSKEQEEAVWRDDGSRVTILTDYVSPDIAPRFAPNSQALLCLVNENQLALWRPNRNIRPMREVHEEGIRHVQFDPTGQWILSRDNSKLAFLWSNTGKLLNLYDKHQTAIATARFSPDGIGLVTGDRDGRAYLWCVDRVVLAQNYGGEAGAIKEIDLIPNSTNFLASYRDGRYVIQTREHGQEYPLFTTRRPVKKAFHPDGRYMALQLDNQPINLWNPATGQIAREIDPGNAELIDYTFTPDGRQLAAVDTEGEIHLWSLDGQVVRVAETGLATAGSVVISEAGNYLAVGHIPMPISIASNMISMRPIPVAFSPNGQYVAAGAAYYPPIYRLGRPTRGVPELEQVKLEQSTGVPTSSAQEDGLRIWNTDGSLRATISKQLVNLPASISFSPDGSLMAVERFMQGTIVFDSRGRLVMPIYRALDGPDKVLFSPDDRHLLATYGNRKNIVRILTKEGTQVADLNQFNGNISTARFSPDGSHILVIGTGRTAQVYTVQGQLVASLEQHDDRLESAYFTDDQQFVLTLDRSGSARLYPLPDRIYAWLKAEARLPALTETEKQRYGLSEFDLDNGE